MPKRRPSRHDPRTQPTTTPIDSPSGWIAQRYHSMEGGADYTCPRCNRPVPKRSQHVVAWRSDEDDHHRHWHTNCWTSAVREGIERYRFV